MDGEVSFFDHLRTALERSPEASGFLERVCNALNKRGGVPSSVVIARRCSRLPAAAVELFGSAHLSLSAGGDLHLSLARHLEKLSIQQQKKWIDAVFVAAGITMKETGCRAARSINYDRFRLEYPQFASFIRLSCAQQKETSDKQYSLWCNAAKIVLFLESNGEALTLSDLGARLFGDSKLLRSGALINTAAEWLTLSCCEDPGNYLSLAPEQRQHLKRKALRDHGIIDNRSGITVTLFGPLEYVKGGIVFDQIRKSWECGEPAILTLENLDGIESISISGNQRIITSENESPFCGLARVRTEGVIIYTQGFPNAAVCSLYKLISRFCPQASFLHWGDSDLAGLRIAAILHRIQPLKLWRCDLDTLQYHRHLLIPLRDKESVLQFIDSHPHFPFLPELRFCANHGWLEQERYSGYEQHSKQPRHPTPL